MNEITVIAPNPKYVDKKTYIKEVNDFLRNHPYYRAVRVIRNEFNPNEETVEYLFSYLLLDTLNNTQYQGNLRAELSYKCFYLLVLESLWRLLIYPKFRLDHPFFKQKLQLNKKTRTSLSPHVKLQANLCLSMWKMLERLCSLGRFGYATTTLFQLLWHEPSGLMFPNNTAFDNPSHTTIRNWQNETQNYLRNVMGLSAYKKQHWEQGESLPPLNPFQEWPVSNLILERARNEAVNSPVFRKEFYDPFVDARHKLIHYLHHTRLILLHQSPKGVMTKATR